MVMPVMTARRLPAGLLPGIEEEIDRRTQLKSGYTSPVSPCPTMAVFLPLG